jgi:hypothetical protein
MHAQLEFQQYQDFLPSGATPPTVFEPEHIHSLAICVAQAAQTIIDYCTEMVHGENTRHTAHLEVLVEVLVQLQDRGYVATPERRSTAQRRMGSNGRV